MKKTSLILIVLTLSAATLFAQKNIEKSKKSPEEKAQKISAKWATYLSLSDDQKQKFYDAKLAQISKNRALKDSTKSKEKSGMGLKFKANKEEFVSAVRTIFTPEQFEKWMAKRSDTNDKSKSKRYNRNAKNIGKSKKTNNKNNNEDVNLDSSDDKDDE